MRRLVVGCGYLGERVARIWRQGGDEVYATTRGHKLDALLRAGLRPIVFDVTKGPGLDALPEVDTVLFAVGRSRSGSHMRAAAMRSCCAWQDSTGQGGCRDRSTSPRADRLPVRPMRT